jgi:hypothetical protein
LVENQCEICIAMNKTIAMVVAALGLWYLFRKGQAANALKYNFTGIDFKNRAVEVELINPSTTSLSFTSLVSDISVNDTNVGILDYRQPTLIKGGQAIKVKLPIKVNAAGVLAFVASGLKKIKTVGFNGSITSQGQTIPFNTTLDLNV